MNILQKTKQFLCVCFFALTAPMAQSQTPAFPGAEGFGKYTTGGRGGKVYHVTNLKDDGKEGSLRYAINQTGPRTIVFDISGTIELTSNLSISKDDITIAGQTAPGDGICLKNYSLLVNANNVIIRFMRFRLGTDKPDADGTIDRDATFGRNRENIIIDHCSMSWCTDECASFYGNKNFTMQWCMLSESLRGSLHPKGNHGYGGIWGGQGATFHHNILAHHSSRNPRLCGSRYTNQPDAELVDLRNNVFYNWGFNSGYAAEGGSYNFVNNYYKAGPATDSKVAYRIFQPNADNGENKQPKGVYGHFYIKGNYMHGKGANWDWNGIDVNNTDNKEMTKETIKSSSQFNVQYVTTHTAEIAFEKVLKLSGASLKRDAIDTRIANEAKNGTYTYTGSVLGGKGIIDKPSDVGGWPVLKSEPTPTDTDKDGIPDEWEKQNGLDPNNAADGAALAKDNSGFTNLELYLNSLVAKIMEEGLATNEPISTPSADSAKIMKRGAGSSNQTLTKGSAITSFYYNWENAVTVTVDGALPNGIKYSIDNANKQINFSGSLLDNPGKYSITLKTVGGINEATYNISFTIEPSVVSVNKKKFDFIVGVDGDFKAAVNAAKASKNERFYIFFPNGNYNIGTLTGDSNQKTTYSRAKTSFIGQSMDNVLIYNQSAAEGISITATLYLDSNADEIYMQDITLENKATAVAGADANRFVVLQDRGNMNIFKNVKLLSGQDTYYSTSNSDKTYWENGEIHGTVDFICGGGDVFFNNCLIYLENRRNNVITAPANSSDWGYVFYNCTIDGHSVNEGQYRLGRSWNNKASSVFINTKMKVTPNPEGWGNPMNVVPTRFAEYNSTDANGKAIDLSKRKNIFSFTDKNGVYHETTINPILSASDAEKYTEKNVLGNWNASNSCKLVSAPIVSIENGEMSWFDSDSAMCYFIFKNNVYIDNVTESHFAIPGNALPTDRFTVRAANAMGGLGACSNEISLIDDSAPDTPSEIYYDFIFHYGNGKTTSTINTGNLNKWECTDINAEGYAWSISGRNDKDVLYGADITFNGSSYKTFKNSKGAQNTFFLPKGIAAKKIHFIGYSNAATSGTLTEINGETVSKQMAKTNTSTNYTVKPSVISYEFDVPVCESFTFTFSENQVCFIIAIETEEGSCSSTGISNIKPDEASSLQDNTTFDVQGIRIKKLQHNQVYIKNGEKFIIRE